MNKVWLVEEGNNWERWVVAAFSSKELAQEHVDAWNARPDVVAGHRENRFVQRGHTALDADLDAKSEECYLEIVAREKLSGEWDANGIAIYGAETWAAMKARGEA